MNDWASADEEEEYGYDDNREALSLPDTVRTEPDANGVFTETSYRIKDGEKQKVVRKIKLVTKKKKVSKSIQERRKMPKFGKSADAPPGPEEETTILSRDEVLIEKPGEEAKAAKRAEEDLLKRLRQGRRGRRFAEQMEEKKAGIESKFGDAPKTGGGLRTGTALSEMAAQGNVPASGKFVPPHLRAGADSKSSRFDDSEQNTLRVTNISEDTSDDDLRDLFAPFGRVQRIYLAKDRETQQSRGFAYISFYHREDAEKALQKLNGFGYDHLILGVEWAKPSNKEDVGSQNVMQKGIVSGYGGALPQGMADKGRKGPK